MYIYSYSDCLEKVMKKVKLGKLNQRNKYQASQIFTVYCNNLKNIFLFSNLILSN